MSSPTAALLLVASASLAPVTLGCARHGNASVAIATPPPVGPAPSSDAPIEDVHLPAPVKEAERDAHEALAAMNRDGGTLWGVSLDRAGWMFVLDDRAFFTQDPRTPGYARAAQDLWAGPLPAHVAPANTAVAFAGRSWAMVVLPLPGDDEDAVRLLIHEQWHVVQRENLPLPAAEGGDGAALLDRPAGRVWLVLEWRALAAALRGGPEVDRAIEAALLFRARRYLEATPAERHRERVLDLTEGLAEYTAWRVTGAKPEAVAAFVDARPKELESYVRGFPYADGPAYGFLLDARLPGWTRGITGDSDLQRLLGKTLRAAPPWLEGVLAGDAPNERASHDLKVLAESFATQFQVGPLRASEDVRWARKQRRNAELRARFVDGPTLRIPTRDMPISFDPTTQTPLEGAGTVMTGVDWKGKDGAHLAAPAGALVDSKWSELRVPVAGATLHEGVQGGDVDVETDGWTLHLPAGWALKREGESWVVVGP